MIPEKAQSVVDTLRFLANGWVSTEDDQNWCRDTAKEIEGYDFTEAGWVCPLCKEVVCDDGCPLAPVR